MANPKNVEIMLAEIGGSVAIGIAVGALALLYVGFKVTKFAAKMFLLLIALLILVGVGWYFLGRHAP